MANLTQIEGKMTTATEKARHAAALARIGPILEAAPADLLEELVAQLEPRVEDYDPVADGKARALRQLGAQRQADDGRFR
jgi:hypothetical protein